MANTTANPTDAVAPLGPDPWRIAWNILANDTLLAFALLALAFLLALAAWLPQAPDSASDPMAFSRWWADTQVQSGSSFALLRQIGLFSLEHSLALRGLLALVTLCLVVRLLEGIWRFRVVREGDILHAGRFPLADTGRVAAYLGGLLVVIGLAISSAAGWRVSNLTLGIGQMTSIGHGTPYSLRLDAFDPADAGQLALLRETDLIGEGSLAFERPLRSAGLTIFVTGKGPAIRVSATFTDSQPLRLQTSATSTPAATLLLLLTRDEPDRFFAVPDAGLVVQLSRDAGRLPPIRVQVYRSRVGAVISESEIPSNGQLTVENVILTFGAETYAVLDVVRDPGMPVTLAGMMVLGLGLVLTSIWSARQLGVSTDSHGTRVEAEALNPVTRPTIWGRLQRAAALAGWKIGLAMLSAMVGAMIVRSLARDGMLWPAASAAPAFMGAWLTGCAAVVLPHRMLKWTTGALAAIALAALLIWPGIMFPPSL